MIRARHPLIAVWMLVAVAAVAHAQTQAPSPPRPAGEPPAQGAPQGSSEQVAPKGVPLPEGYRIGAHDVLTVLFWRDQDMSGDVTVRPDGNITLPLVNDIAAAGQTPEQLRQAITDAASQFIESPTVTVVVKQINSRVVFITGEVAKPGAYPLTGRITVMQLISLAGGLREYADEQDITVLRVDKDRQVSLPFNYKDVAGGKKLNQNILLQPGDTVVVP